MCVLQVHLVEMETPSPAPDTLLCVRSLQLQDRAVMDKAQRAFVSYIQAYAKHECNVILRLKGKILCFLHGLKLLYGYTLVVCFITTCLFNYTVGDTLYFF